VAKIDFMDLNQIQYLCERGQDQLSRMEYLSAELSLAVAEELAWTSRDFDALARLYMPLQESRRQRRQRCGEGTIRLDVLANGPHDQPDGRRTVEAIGHGQTLIAGWGSIQPAVEARRAQRELGLYVDVFLAAVYPAESPSPGTPGEGWGEGSLRAAEEDPHPDPLPEYRARGNKVPASNMRLQGRVVVIVPGQDVALPPAEVEAKPSTPMAVDQLIRRLPAHSIMMSDAELPKGPGGTAATYAWVMATWERLHAPFLAAAEATGDPIRRIEAYRQTIAVDYACELAHQRISDTARKLCAKGTS
jgi:hypothetical protein